jgi:ATP-dependent DNA helicase RecG
VNPAVIREIDVRDYLNQGMGAELHWFADVSNPTDLAVTLAAMANGNGGTVLIGVTSQGAKPKASADQVAFLRGVRHPSETIDRIFQSILLSEPPLVLPLPKVVQKGGANLVVISIPPGLPNVYSVDGRYYGRIGQRNEPLAPRRLRQLLIERGVVQFESQSPPGATLDDLDLDQVQSYVAEVNLPFKLDSGSYSVQPAREHWQQVLLRRGCLRILDGQLSPTYAALLLFGRTPQQWLPSAMILAARFSGKGFSDQFVRQEIHGSLPEQLRQSEAFLRANMRTLVKMSGLAHEESWEYPFEAVRELLVNAVAHRDYNAQGDTIHLHLFTDRLEIHSPGGLPGPVNLENLLDARFARNAVITQALADLGFVERLGYGLDRVVEAMQRRGLSPPRFEEIARSFRVTLYNEMEQLDSDPTLPDWIIQISLDLNTRQKSALRFLMRQHRITNRDYQEICPEVHVETLRRDLAELVSLGLLIKIGDKRATYYILKK